MNGLMMDYQLTLPTLLRRAETVQRREGDRHAPAGPSFHRTTYARDCRRARALAVGLAGPRPAARRPRGDALLEPLPAPRGVPRHPVRRLRAAHAEPAAASERPRVHRDARRRPRGDRRPGLLPLLEQFVDRTPIEHVLVVEDAYEDLVSVGRRRRAGVTRSSTRTRPRRCATRAARPGCRRASSTRTARRCCTRSASPRATRWGSASPSPTRSCPSCRCSTRTRGAIRTSRR